MPFYFLFCSGIILYTIYYLLVEGRGRGILLSGPQEAGAKFGIPKPIFPFSPVNLLDKIHLKS